MFQEIISILLNPVFDTGFITQLLIPSLIMLFATKKRNHFWLRFVLLIVALYVSCYLIPFRPFSSFNLSNELTILWTIFGYLIHFAILIACLYFIFDNSFVKTMFICMIAYNVQHSIYAFSKIFEISFDAYRALPFLYMSLQWIPNILIAFVIYKKIKDAQDFRIKSVTVILVSIVTIALNIVLSVLSEPDNVEPSLFVYSYLVATFIGCLAFFLLLVANIKQSALFSRIDETKRMWVEDRKNYEIEKEALNQFAIKTHDLKHFVRSLKGEINQTELDKIDDILSGIGYNYLYETGSLALDVILNLKSKECQTKNIVFNFIGDGKLIDFIDGIDIYTLFGNILDNAIEAVSNLEPSKRIIHLSFYEQKGAIIITSENYFSGKLNKNENGFLTTKQDRNNHGYGIQSIEYIVKKYSGLLKLEDKEGQFFLRIVFTK